MQFDISSYLLGLLSATVVSFIIWRARARLASVQESAESQIEGTRRFIGRAADARYYRDMISFLQGYHVAGSLINLSEILLEPRLIPAPAPLYPPGSEDAPARSVFDVVPRFHELPQSYAPFNIETLSLDDLGSGDRHVAILGTNGSGKSTTLATLALMALGEVEFETLEDLTEQAIREEEKKLPKEERERRARERQQIQERALDKLHDVHERERAQLPEIQQVEKLPALDITKLVPIFIHLSDLDFSSVSSGKDNTIDPAELLVRAVQRHVSSVTGQVVGSVIYPALEVGRALVLLDGYDELAPELRQPYFHWIQEFLATYEHNMVVIAGPVEGYEPLIALGFTPAFLRPWREEDYAVLARRWGAIWATKGKGRRKAAPPDDQAMRRIMIDNRGRSALDVTLKIWAGLADDVRETGRAGWYDALVNRRLSQPDYREVLPAVAAETVREGHRITRDKLHEAVTAAVPPAEGKKAPKPEEIVSVLVSDKLLVECAGNSFMFPHPQIASYLASEALVQAGSEQAVELALDPNWSDTLSYAAARLNMLPVIYRKLSATPDLRYSNLFGLVHWLPDAPPDAPWRGDMFKRLAGALMAPEQFPDVRARAMAAMIATRDKNILFILRQALRAADPDIRRLACVGLGALGSSEAIKDLAPLLGDEHRDVQLAAGLALGAIGTEAALEVMVEGLIQGTDELRQAVAEALAAIPDEGHAVLRDGIVSEDIMIRRACVAGLSRVKAPWALVALYRAMIEDDQWYVRNAAEEAFVEAQSPEHDGPRAHPEADTLVWLVQWAADKGEGVPAGANARQILVRVLQEGNPAHKIMAALTLARLGHVQALKPLYAALRDKNPEVRSAAYSALTELQTRTGEPLPGIA